MKVYILSPASKVYSVAICLLTICNIFLLSMCNVLCMQYSFVVFTRILQIPFNSAIIADATCCHRVNRTGIPVNSDKT